VLDVAAGWQGLKAFIEGLSFSNYSDTLGDEVFWTAIRTSVIVGLLTAAVG